MGISLGTSIKVARIQQGLTQQQLASHVGCSRVSVSYCENNRPEYHQLAQRLAMYLRVV